MKPAFYATTCGAHNKAKFLHCGCVMYVIHRRLKLYTHEQIKRAYHQGQKDAHTRKYRNIDSL